MFDNVCELQRQNIEFSTASREIADLHNKFT